MPPATSDTLDAEVAARSVLAGQSTAIPQTADGAVEMMRQLKITRDTAVKARTTAMHTLQQIVVHAPICQDTRSGGLDELLASAKIGHDALGDLASENTFQAPDDLPFGSAVRRATSSTVG